MDSKTEQSTSLVPIHPYLHRVELKIEGIIYRIHNRREGHDPKGVRKGVIRPDFQVRPGSEGPELVFELRSLLQPDKVQETVRYVTRRERAALLAFPGVGLGRRLLPGVPLKRRRNSRAATRYKVAAGVLLCLLFMVSGYAAWAYQNLEKNKTDIDREINRIQARLTAGDADTREVDALIDKLDGYQERARDLQKNILYRLGVRNSEQDFIEGEIKSLMSEFGAEQYNIPPEFVRQVEHFVRQYRNEQRPLIARALGHFRDKFDMIRRILRQDRLPEDLAYMALVESGLETDALSEAGATGAWQFMEATARDYGMEISDSVDERLDLEKSTRAASRYIRDLILDLGSGSSVMLALAAYNGGLERVRRVVRSVKDPIRQRNFWYLYRIRALPEETRAYVPKVIAAMIIGRNAERFGFQVADDTRTMASSSSY